MQELKKWLQKTPYSEGKLSVASSDASFRKYYRLVVGTKSYILMDASLEKHSLDAFIDVTHRLRSGGVHAPSIVYEDKERGYLLLEDFGTTNFYECLQSSDYKRWYAKAIDILVVMQEVTTNNLPLYDRDFLQQEMELMQIWYLEKKLALQLSDSIGEMLTTTLHKILDVVEEQPCDVFVHRDFHSRNIMVLEDETLGIIDYQDARKGAVTYDLVSLLKDCYIAFEREDIEKLALSFRDKKGLHVSDAMFLKWFDFMGLQRHIKVLGIFSRLFLRDAKENYLQDIPLTRRYVIETAKRYEETLPLALFLEEFTQ